MTRARRAFIGRDESGQSLFIVIVAMTVILGSAALAIDAGTWFVARHHAQVSADASALAGANCMADGGTATTGTGSTNCLGVATSTQYAPAGTVVCINDYQNLGMVCSNGKPDPDSSQAEYTVEAWVGAHQQAYFSSAVGVSPSPTYTKLAVATYISGLTPYALFAKDPTCSNGINFGNKGNGGSNNDIITGGVHSNGSLFGGLGGSSTVGSISYGCPTSGTTSGNQLSSNGNTTVSVPPIQTTNSAPWPVPYDSSSCTLQGATPGTTINCYFDPSSACTYTAGNTTETPPANVVSSYSSSEHAYDITITGNVGSSGSYSVLCAPGGTITIGGGTNTSIYGTLYAANFSWPSNQNNISLYPPANALGIYYTGSGTLTLGGNKFNANLEGAYIYAPNGTVQMYGNNGSGFIEAQDINISGNGWTFEGAGPREPGNYGDSLVQ